MKTIIQFIVLSIIIVLCFECKEKKHSTVWEITDVKSNYIPKGPIENSEYPLYVKETKESLKGTKVNLEDSLLIITQLNKNFTGSALSDDFGDTLILKKKVFFKFKEDDEYSKIYPGDELIDCDLEGSDTCIASQAFLEILGIKSGGVTGFLSNEGESMDISCILFILKENEEMVLLSQNDFTLFFFSKQQ